MKAATIGLVLLTLLAVSIGWSSDAEDEAAAIRKRVESYVAAYNQHDAAAVAGHWSEDAVYVSPDTGKRIHGRAAIESMFKSLFDDDSTAKLSVTVDTIRLITPEVAIEDGTAELVSSDGEPEKSTYTAVNVKNDGVWYVDSVRETDTPPPPAPEPSQLDQLAWLVGDWLDQDDEASIRTRWEWTKNKHFLTSTFSVNVEDRIELEGTQVIGWDPVAGQLRSWVFDSEGGFGEGVWRRAGNQWTVETKSTLHDGSQGSAVNVYTFVDENTFNWKSVDREMDGEAQPDIDEVAVHRQ